MKSIFDLVFALCLVSSTLADLAIDTTSALTANQWQCLKNNGFDTMLARVYTPDGAFDEVGIENIIQAKNTGVSYFPYIVPCVANCKNNLTSGAAQAYVVANRLNPVFGDPEFGFVPSTFILVDKSSNWSTDQKQNQQLVNDMVNALFAATTSAGVGVITNYNSWSSIVGANFTAAFAQNIWWVNWNGNQDLTSGWAPFASWVTPFAHQYAGRIASNNCTPGISLNYSYIAGNSFSKLRKDRKMIRRGNMLKKFNSH